MLYNLKDSFPSKHIDSVYFNTEVQVCSFAFYCLNYWR